jgi:hypothetical protein
MTLSSRVYSLITSCVLASGALAAPTDTHDLDVDGITVRRGAVVLFGSPASCSQPGSIQLRKLQRRTPEWKTIRVEGVREGTARHDLLTTRMNERITRAARLAASDRGCDCVLRKSDILDARGKTIRDLTDDVIAQLSRV